MCSFVIKQVQCMPTKFNFQFSIFEVKLLIILKQQAPVRRAAVAVWLSVVHLAFNYRVVSETLSFKISRRFGRRFVPRVRKRVFASFRPRFAEFRISDLNF